MCVHMHHKQTKYYLVSVSCMQAQFRDQLCRLDTEVMGPTNRSRLSEAAQGEEDLPAEVEEVRVKP